MIIIDNDEKHRVTSPMITTTREMASQLAPDFEAEASDGRTYVLHDVSKNIPVFLVFIKDGCPCSEAAQPFYNQLYHAYGGRVWFFGVIDGDRKLAKRWALANQVSFPILCDPDLKIIHDYKVENSAYVAIVTPAGSIDRMWPGYSQPMLTEVGERLARLSDVPVKPIDVSASPVEPYTGCPF
jgi:peroxiredoxin